MDAVFVPQEDLTQQLQEQELGDIKYIMEMLETNGYIEYMFKSKNLVNILMCLVEQYHRGDWDKLKLVKYGLCRIRNLGSCKFILLEEEIKKKYKKLHYLFQNLMDVLQNINKSVNKILQQKYFRNFNGNYKREVSLNIGDIVVYSKMNKSWFNPSNYLCIVNKITDKSYCLETVYTNAKTFRKNLYGEDLYKYSDLFPQMCCTETDKTIKQYELFDTIFRDKQKIIHKKNSPRGLGFHFEKIYKNNEGIYCGTDFLQMEKILGALGIRWRE